MLRLTERVSAPGSHGRTARARVRDAGSRASRYGTWTGRSAFSERFASGIRIPTRLLSQNRRAHGHASDEVRLGTIRDNIAHHQGSSPYPPKNVEDLASINETYRATHAKFEAIDEALRKPSSSDRRAFKRAEGAGNLLTSFHLISTADKIFLCTGTNCTDGKPQLDGPLATALLAHSLYQVHKVPIILADRTNIAMVRELLGKLNANAAEYLRYVEINAVNGMLVNAIDNLINIHHPDAIVHIGTPGRAGNGLYYDAEGNFIGEYNMAVDQVMNLANALGTMTIALGHSATQAGMKGIQGDAISADKHAGLRASHQILGQSATSGALALGSLLVAAYKDADLCSPKRVEEMFSAGRKAQVSEAFVAKPVARPEIRDSEPIYKRDATEVREKEHARLQQALGSFDSLRQAIHAERMPWPQTIEEQHLYGPKQRHIFAVDSSDGVLVAAKPFANRVRARSPYVLNMLLVADHKNAPYGPLRDGPRDKHVHSMLRYTIRQGKELVIVVMMCNTACLSKLGDIKQRILEELKSEAGERKVELDVHIIDLIEHTAEAIIARGGHKVVLLSTEKTAEKPRYPEEIRKAAKGAPPPTIIRIGCGNSNDKALKDKDWATLINEGAYKADKHSPVRRMLEVEINRYVDQIPLDSTSVWLCCTHFPAIKNLIEARLAERLKKAGLTHTIPVFDPMEDQADALIGKLYELDKGERPVYSSLPQFSIHTSGSDIKVKMAAMRHGLEDAVVQTVDFDAGIAKRRKRASGNPAKGKTAARARTEKPLPPETAAPRS